MAKALSFSSEIFIIGVNPYVPVPKGILEQLFIDAQRNSGPIPVKGTLNGKLFIQTVVKYSDLWRLYLNGIMRKDAGIDVGDVAHVTLAFNAHPKVEHMPVLLLEALKKDAAAKSAYEVLAPYRKKEILRYLNSMKTEESLARNIGKIILHLKGEKTDTLHALMRTKK